MKELSSEYAVLSIIVIFPIGYARLSTDFSLDQTERKCTPPKQSLDLVQFVARTEQLNLRTLACVQWDECFITIMYKGTLALDTAAFWSAYISRKTPACTAAKYC